MVAKLKARYAGARRPVARTALKLLRMRRDSGKTPQQFAHRLHAGLRNLKERTVEWGTTDATPKIAAYEEVTREALMAEMPDKIRRQLRGGAQRSLEAAIVVVDDDEDDVRVAREEREWAIVEKRRPSHNHRHNRRHDSERQRDQRREDQRQGNQRQRKAEPQRPQVQRILCWTCGSSRHLSWACSRRRPAGPEPMEVNATAATRRGRRPSMSKRESDASDSASTSASDRLSSTCSSGSEGPSGGPTLR
ncbi:hypothetical protein AAG570_010007 [Ranatra chinensis]|uniref:CCHC-type domain-containing protein n=1 Tax=Ranatra chinensis TaxID=642074 RepID=A0ABD0YNH1_9HEMI